MIKKMFTHTKGNEFKLILNEHTIYWPGEKEWKSELSFLNIDLQKETDLFNKLVIKKHIEYVENEGYDPRNSKKVQSECRNEVIKQMFDVAGPVHGTVSNVVENIHHEQFVIGYDELIKSNHYWSDSSNPLYNVELNNRYSKTHVKFQIDPQTKSWQLDVRNSSTCPVKVNGKDFKSQYQFSLPLDASNKKYLIEFLNKKMEPYMEIQIELGK